MDNDNICLICGFMYSFTILCTITTTLSKRGCKMIQSKTKVCTAQTSYIPFILFSSSVRIAIPAAANKANLWILFVFKKLLFLHCYCFSCLPSIWATFYYILNNHNDSLLVFNHNSPASDWMQLLHAMSFHCWLHCKIWLCVVIFFFI